MMIVIQCMVIVGVKLMTLECQIFDVGWVNRLTAGGVNELTRQVVGCVMTLTCQMYDSDKNCHQKRQSFDILAY
jgi:hypothetical protein